MPNRGGSKGKGSKPSVRSLSRERLSQESLEAFIQEFVGASDRACALLGGALLDNVLRDLLSTYMRGNWPDLEDVIFENQAAPLKDFGSRTKMAYALEAISEDTKEQLDTIRLIRNAFAHSETPITFNNTLVAEECEKLVNKRLPVTKPEEQSRSKFVANCFDVALSLGADAAERRKRMDLVNAIKYLRQRTLQEK